MKKRLLSVLMALIAIIIPTNSWAQDVAGDETVFGEAIDLGLPSGTKWASWNVGASKPEDFGGFYAWGETEEKDTYSWDNYLYGSYNYEDGSSQMVDIGSDIGGTDYDVAHMKWGGDWRLPSLEHINELRNNCSYEWTTLNGVNGCRFTGPNGNSIFLPAAGRWYNGTLESVGSYGDYQSSTKREPEGGEKISVFSEGLLFNSELCTWSYANPVWGQYCGRNVRPIIPGTPQNEPEPYAVLSDNNTVLTFYYDDQREQRNGMSVGPFEDLGKSINSGWYDVNEHITTVVFDDSFANCTTLTSTAYWFYQCENLTTITGISNLKTDNVTDINSMFADCHSLNNIDLSSLNFSNVTNMHQVFEDCRTLESVNFTGVNTDNVTNMGDLFLNCHNLRSVDLSSFNTNKVTNMEYMFYRCDSLTTIYVGEGWTTASVTDSKRMFEDCTHLVGGAGTHYDENHIDHTYARIDGGTANPGYFTAINGISGEAWFDGLTAYVMGEATLDDAFAQTGGRNEAAKTIAAIVWEGNTALTADMLQGISNPNLLVYVNEPSMAPQGVQNVVISGQAKEIVLTDATSGNNNFFCPEPFMAEKISYTREFKQHTEIGVSRGWEGLALPFNVQTITHETHGELAPFSTGNNNAKPFWLRAYDGERLYSAEQMEAYAPYVIAMPNSNDYFPEFNQAGRVTFSAVNTEVHETPDFSFLENEPNMPMMTIPAFQSKAQSDSIYAINVGQARGNFAEGSVFESGLREVRPFEIYTVHHGQGARPRFIPIPVQGNEPNGIADIMATEPTDHSQWYDLSGRRLSGEPMSKGIYIHKGQKVKKMKK